MLKNQENVKSRSDKGYHVVPPPYTGNYIPPKPDLMFINEQVKSEYVDVVSNVASSDVKTFESKHESVDVKNKGVYSTEETKPIRKNNFSPLIIEHWNPDDESKIEFVPKVESCKASVEQHKKVNHKNFANKMTHPHPKRRFIPQEILTKSGKLKTAGSPVNTVRPVNTADSKPNMNYSRPISNAFKKGHSQVIRPYNKYSSYNKTIFNKMANTLRVKDTTAMERAVGNPQQKEYKEKGVIDSGCSRHMTGNKCYLSDYENDDGGFVSFEDGKGRISGKGKIKTKTLDFDDVYFCKELKYDMYSVSQMFYKKKHVLFTNTKCLVLSFNFKLLDESQVLLRFPRKGNIYSVDLKSVVPTGGIKREFNVTRTPQQNGVAERKNKTLIEATKTMLVDSKLPTTFWAKAVNTACYVLNRALVIKPHNKTPYELIHERPPPIDFMKPFGYPITILNTKDSLGKFDGKLMRDFLLGKQTNSIAGTKDNIVAGLKDSVVDAGKKATKVNESRVLENGRHDDQFTKSKFEGLLQQERQTEHINSTNSFNTIVLPVNTAGPSFANTASPLHINVAGTPASTNAFEEHPFEPFSPFKIAFSLPYVPIVTLINYTGIFGNAYDDEVVEEVVDMNNVVSSYTIPDASVTKFLKDYPKDQTLVDLPKDKWALGTKWVFRNKKDKRGIVVKNKARLVAQGHTLEEFYQMDVKSAFLYGKIEKEVYVCQPPGFEDPNFPDKVYKVEKAIYGLHHTPRACYETLPTYLMYNGLQVQQKSDGIFISQEKYMADILKKFDFTTVKTASTLIEPNKTLVKDAEAKDVDVHLYRLMIGSLMYLTASRPDITFVVYACARFQVTPKTSHLHAREAPEVPHTEPQAKEIVPTPSHDPLPNGEDRLQLNELMDICTKLSNMVIFQTKTNQASEIKKLKKIVKKLKGKKKKKKRNHRLKRLYKVRLSARVESSKDEEGLGAQEDVTKQRRIVEIDANEDLFLIDETAQDQKRIKIKTCLGIEGIAAATALQISKDKLTLAQTLMEIKAAKPKAIWVTIQEPSGKKIALDEEVARKLEAEMKAEMDEEERIARYKNKANRAIIKEWDDDLSKRTSKEKSINDIKKMFDKVYKRVNTFMDMNTENVEESLKKTQEEVTEGSSKRARQELEQESAKKQKLEQAKVVDDDTTDLKRCLKIVPEDDVDVAIKATPISSKSPTIVDYKIYIEGKKSYIKIIRADRDS
nr:hypothetical protein [Tanacetum cinerariifolium]